VLVGYVLGPVLSDRHVYKISVRIQTHIHVKMMSKLVDRAAVNAFFQLDHVSCLATWRETNTS
jgi:hypothetical protein